MNYKHFTTFKRRKLEILNRLRYSTSKIAKEIYRYNLSIAGVRP